MFGLAIRNPRPRLPLPQVPVGTGVKVLARGGDSQVTLGDLVIPEGPAVQAGLVGLRVHAVRDATAAVAIAIAGSLPHLVPGVPGLPGHPGPAGVVPLVVAVSLVVPPTHAAPVAPLGQGTV